MPDFEHIQLGDEAKLTHQITEADVQTFATLTGDDNPLHMQESFASQTAFKQRVAHGMLTASFLSTMVGTLLPGHGALYHSQQLNFKKPVFIDDIIEVKATVTQKVQSTRMVVIKTVITNQHRQVVLDGVAKVTWAAAEGGVFDE